MEQLNKSFTLDDRTIQSSLNDVAGGSLQQVLLTDNSVAACQVILVAGYEIYSLTYTALQTLKEHGPSDEGEGIYSDVEARIIAHQPVYVAFVPQHVLEQATIALQREG